MYQIVYLSAAVELFSEEELTRILIKSRENNLKAQVSGVLLYYGGSIIQVLEGEKEQVLKTYNRISKDYRHRGIIKMLDRNIEVRAFPDWSMGFKAISHDQLEQVLGYAQLESIDKENRSAANSTEDVMTLLQIFIDANKHNDL